MRRVAKRGDIDEGVAYCWPHIWDRYPMGWFKCTNCGKFSKSPSLFGCEPRSSDAKPYAEFGHGEPARP